MLSDGRSRDKLQPRLVDAYWLQREVNKFFNDPMVSWNAYVYMYMYVALHVYRTCRCVHTCTVHNMLHCNMHNTRVRAHGCLKFMGQQMGCACAYTEKPFVLYIHNVHVYMYACEPIRSLIRGGGRLHGVGRLFERIRRIH